MKNQYRQGDVLIEKMEAIPENAIPVKEVAGRFILAEGEATGHHHAISARGAQMLSAGDELWLKLDQASVVHHEEHGAIALEPGIYRVRRQVETWLDEVRQVRD